MRLRKMALLGFLVVLGGCLERRDGDTTPEQDECTPCHGGKNDAWSSPPESGMPPFNLAGETERSARGNGAHAIHLSGSETFRALACSECHLVPETVDAPSHLDDPYPAEIVFTGPAKAFKAQPTFEADTGTCASTFCHGDSFVGGRPSGGTLTAVEWTDTSGRPSECGACHGLPPPRPHPPEDQCSDCHKNMDEDGGFVRPDLHVDGVVNFYLPDESDEP